MYTETNKTDNKEFWTLPELSRLTGKSRGAVVGWIKSGKLKCRRLGVQYRIYKADFEDFVAACNNGEVVEI